MWSRRQREEKGEGRKEGKEKELNIWRRKISFCGGEEKRTGKTEQNIWRMKIFLLEEEGYIWRIKILSAEEKKKLLWTDGRI